MNKRRTSNIPMILFVLGLVAVLAGGFIAMEDLKDLMANTVLHSKYGPYSAARFGGFIGCIGTGLCLLALIIHRTHK